MKRYYPSFKVTLAVSVGVVVLVRNGLLAVWAGRLLRAA